METIGIGYAGFPVILALSWDNEAENGSYYFWGLGFRV